MELGLIVIGSFAVLFVAALVHGVIEHRHTNINCVVGFISMEEYNETYGTPDR